MQKFEENPFRKSKKIHVAKTINTKLYFYVEKINRRSCRKLYDKHSKVNHFFMESKLGANLKDQRRNYPFLAWQEFLQDLKSDHCIEFLSKSIRFFDVTYSFHFPY